MKLSTSDPDPYASEKNGAPESNFSSDGDVPASLSLIDPNPGVLVFSDDIWIVYIPGVDKDIYLLQDLDFSDYFDADSLSIEVSVYTDTEGVQKY